VIGTDHLSDERRQKLGAAASGDGGVALCAPSEIDYVADRRLVKFPCGSGAQVIEMIRLRSLK
jgi:hypothetical protein